MDKGRGIYMADQMDVAKLVADSENLPNVPAIARELLGIPEWEDVDLRHVADLISKDVALATKVLRMVNSSFYGMPREIGTISQALVVLGLRATRALTLSFSLISISPRDKTSEFDYSGFWTRSVNTATTAREIAVAVSYPDEEEAFLTGLLQDIGVMALAYCAKERYGPVLEASPDPLAPPLELERTHLGTDHAEVTRLLLEKWNLPPSLCIPVLHHRDPDAAVNADPHARTAIQIQHLAHRVDNWLYTAQGDAVSLGRLRDMAEQTLDIPADALDALMERVDTHMADNTALFELKAERPETYAALLQLANLELGQMANEQEALVKELETAKKQSEKLSLKLRHTLSKVLNEAEHDVLTGLGNRRMFQRFLNGELARCVRYEHTVVLLFIDIDNFKQLNDTRGHLAGDAALKGLADVLMRTLRAADTVARYGGEEFVAALVETDEEQGLLAAERVRSAVEKHNFALEAEKAPSRMTVSIGMVTWDATQKLQSSDELIQRADHAMYAAKRAGKNRVEVAPPAPE
jgi:diguanylate cyclase (GGDEF)-like protein